jgi:hypothetical protein
MPLKCELFVKENPQLMQVWVFSPLSNCDWASRDSRCYRRVLIYPMSREVNKLIFIRYKVTPSAVSQARASCRVALRMVLLVERDGETASTAASLA